MKNVVITGSTRGIGFSMATEFLRAGCNVTLSGRGEALQEEVSVFYDGEESEVIVDEKFKKIFNILADKPETVAKFFIPRILGNIKNDTQIAYLTNQKATWRLLTAGIRKDRLI